MSKWKDTYPIACENYEHLFKSSSFGPTLSGCYRQGYSDQEVCIILRLKLKNIPVRHKLFQQIRHRSHLEWRYQVVTVKYNSASLRRCLLIYGKVDGYVKWDNIRKQFDSCSDEYFHRKGITNPEEISETRKSKYDSNSLQFFVNKYGEEIGKEKFQDNRDFHADVTNQMISSGKLRNIGEIRPHSLEWWISECNDLDEAVSKHTKYVKSQKANTPSIANLVKSGMTEEEASLKFKEGSVRCIEYWMKHGYSESEAITEVARVNCRSLEFFVNKYSKEEGRKRWDAKCSKWAKSYYNKSSTELSDINKSKGGGQCGVHRKSEIPQELDGLLYLIQHKSGFLKIGITQKKSVRRRYQNFDRSWNIVFEKKMSLSDAFKIEQDVIERFKPMAREYDLYYSKETFHKAILGDIVRYVNQTTMKDEDREFLKNCAENAEKRVCFNR